MKKLLSIMLVLSMLATSMLLAQTVSAATDSEPYKVLIYSENFDDPSKVSKVDTTWDTSAKCATWYSSNGLTFEDRADNGKCAVKTSTGAESYTHFAFPETIYRKDDVTYEITFDYYATGGDEVIYLGGTTTSTSSDAVVILQGNNALAANQWHEIKIIFNVNKKIFTVNGISRDNSKPFAYNEYRKLAVVPKNNKGSKFDNFKMYKYTYPPKVTKVSFVDNLGNEITDLNDMTPAVSAVKVKFENVASIDTILENFWIFNEDTQEEVTLGETTFVDNVFTATLPEAYRAEQIIQSMFQKKLKMEKMKQCLRLYIFH